MPKKLSDSELEKLQEWLQKFCFQKPISMNNLYRDFSDGVLMATILKEIRPKLIEMHNYPSSSSFKLKRINWETLNNKVFKKLGIQQSSKTLDAIAKSTPGIVEQVLYNIMRLEDEIQKNSIQSQIQEDEARLMTGDDLVMVNVNKQIGDAIVQVPQKMILYSMYEEALRNLTEKTVQNEVFWQKITHLENIIELKNERIEELSRQLCNMSLKDDSVKTGNPASTTSFFD